MIQPFNDEYFMKKAMEEAHKAFSKGEIPVGAVVVSHNQIIARGHNLTQTLNDVTAHAEMIAYTAASEYLGSKYLSDCTLYVTLEPCVMCAGASYWTQISKIVIGAKDPKRGFSLLPENVLHPKTEMCWGVLEQESRALLQQFFAQKR